MSEKELLLPDIGDFKEVEVIELLVAEGDTVAAEDSLLILESDKATMDIPSPYAGTIKKLSVKVGDKISEGSLLGKIEVGAASADAPVEQKEDKPSAETPRWLCWAPGRAATPRHSGPRTWVKRLS